MYNLLAATQPVTEYSVVTIIIVLFGFLVAVCTPLLKLVGTISTLAQCVKGMDSTIKKLTDTNDEEHKLFKEHLETLSLKVCEHEVKIETILKEELK